MKHIGQTTRLANEAIEQLFTTGFCSVKDHINTEQNRMRLYGIIFRRLRLEHGDSLKHIFFDYPHSITYDTKRINQAYVKKKQPVFELKAIH